MKEITKKVLDWEKIRAIVFDKTGKVYSKTYLMGVRNGSNRNQKVEDVLKEIGVKYNE